MIIGIDTKSSGVAMCAVMGDEPFVAKSYNIKTKDRKYHDVLGDLYDYVSTHISAHDVVFVEEPVYVQNRQTVIKLSAAYGAVLAAIGNQEATAYTVPVSLWKLHTVGKGNASKLDVSQWLHSQHPHHHAQCSDQDAMDASCIALYGSAYLKGLDDGGHVLHQAPD